MRQQELILLSSGEVYSVFMNACGPGRAFFYNPGNQYYGKDYVVFDIAAGEIVAYSDARYRWYTDTSYVIDMTDGSQRVRVGRELCVAQQAWMDPESGVACLDMGPKGWRIFDPAGSLPADSLSLGAERLELFGGGYFAAYFSQGTPKLYSPQGQLLCDGGYSAIQPVCDRKGKETPGLFLCSRGEGDAILYDLLGPDGSPIVKGISDLIALDSQGLAICKDGSVGMMDWQGDWVWSLMPGMPGHKALEAVL